MSCQKLSRKCLHLVSNQGRGLYSLSRMDVSGLFYPSTAAAEAKYKKTKDTINKLGVVGSIGRLPGPSINFRPYRSVVPNTHSLVNVFTRFSESKNKIICSDEFGNTGFYNTECNSFESAPELNSPKGSNSVVVSIPCTDADNMAGSINTDSIYILDMIPAGTCCFEVLSYNPVGNWSWRPLPLPPFFNDPEYKAPAFPPSYVVDGTSFCVSTNNATYAFDTVTSKWSKVGDWVLPFKAEYIPELGLWLGLSNCKPYGLCAFECMPTVVGSSPPKVQQVGKAFEPPKSWSPLMCTMVNVGSCRFCVANVFDIITDNDQYETVEVTVFTGVEVLPSESGLRMIMHKTKCFIASIMDVL